ncbi:MAG: aminoacyl-tRNA hydrolase [Anaerolineae bacterium]|nr:aminoacyl-tRNA hydrolase [Anaerolineae bacterium]
MSETDTLWTLIVGLGNPGREHQHNRHNVGFHCLDRLAEKYGLAFTKKQHQAELTQGRIAGQKVLLAKPQTYVNLSGEAVGALARFYKINPENILVIYDDLDLPQGATRLRPDGGSGGHNGIKSIVQHLNSQAFPRLRVGIGRPPGRMEPKDYVLQDFGPDERVVMDEVYARVANAVEVFIAAGVKEAMNQFNITPKAESEKGD